MNPTSLRRATAAAVALALSLALAACGSDDSEPTDDTTTAATTDEPTPDESATVLTEDEMTSALLTPEDLPGGYVLDPDDGDDSSNGFQGSCLEDVSNLTDQPEFEADEKVEASFVLEGDAGQSSVKSQVQSYADQEQVVTAIELFSSTVAACPTATGTDDDGLSYDLEVQSDQTVSLSGVDQQASVAVSGTITTQGLELPVDIGFNVARVGNNLVIISTLDVGEVGDGVVPGTETLGQVSVDRLADVTG